MQSIVHEVLSDVKKRHNHLIREMVCVNKVAYRSEIAAKRGVRVSKIKFDTNLKPYKCEICKKWHLTKTNKDVNVWQV
jgi:hypothetical protein